MEKALHQSACADILGEGDGRILREAWGLEELAAHQPAHPRIVAPGQSRTRPHSLSIGIGLKPGSTGAGPESGPLQQAGSLDASGVAFNQKAVWQAWYLGHEVGLVHRPIELILKPGIKTPRRRGEGGDSRISYMSGRQNEGGGPGG